MSSIVGAKGTYVFQSLVLAAVVGLSMLAFVGDSAVKQKTASKMPTFQTKEIPGSYFGITIIDIQLTSQIQFGSRRTWNARSVAWPEISPAPNVYNWSNLDRILDRAQELGHDVLYTFGRTPRWASSNPDAPTPGYGLGECAPPSSIHYWDDFIRTIVTRASGRIKYWETWNEPQELPPNGFYCGDISTMVELQRHAYEIIKSVDPSAMVLTPSAVGSVGPPWMARFLAHGGGKYADIMAIHGYLAPRAKAETIIETVANFRAVFAQYGQEAKPIWDTEASWGHDPWLPDSDLQAAFLAKFYLLHWSTGVERFYWYGYDEPLWGTLWDSNSGVHEAGVAYREVRKWMIGATMERSCTLDAGVWICRLSRPNGYHAIAAWTQTGVSILPVEGKFKQYRDLTGKITSIGSHNVPISTSPILIETEPFIPD